MPVSAGGFALFRQQDIGHLRKGLHLYNKCICVVKMRLKLQLVGFWNDQKSANVVMWKNREYEYISSSWNKQHKEAPHSSLAKCQPKRMWNNSVRCGIGPLISIFFSWMRSTTLKSKISSMMTIETRPFWSYSNILRKVLYRNIWCMFIILVANIMWCSGHAIRSSSSLLDFSFLHQIKSLHSFLCHSYVT